MRTRWMATLLVAMAVTLTGCGDSPEHKLLTANHMLRSNKPADALRLANEVLASDLNPEHAEQMRVQAIEIKVLSLLSLNQLESARKSLEDYRKEKPEDSEPVRLMGVWAQRTMSTAVGKADFFTSIELQKQFDDALIVGENMADVLIAKFNKTVDAEMLRARLIMQDVERYRRMIEEENRKAERYRLMNDQAGQDQANLAKQRVERTMLSRSMQAEEHLLKVIQLQPLHQEAVLTYLNLLTAPGRDGNKEIFDLANRLAAAKDLPALLAHSTGMAVLNIDRAVRSDAARADLVARVLEAVPASQRNSPHWLLATSHVMLMKGQTAEASSTLDQIQGGDAQIQMQKNYLQAFALYQQKKLDRARLILDQLQAQASGSPQVLVLHGRVLLELRDGTLAKEQARRALAIDPSFAPAQILLLDCEAVEGKDTTVDSAIDKDPGNIVANRLRISKLINAGNKGELERHLESLAKNVLPLKDEHVAMLIEGYAYLERWDKMLFFANELKRMRPDALAAHLKYAEAIVAQDPKDGPIRAAKYLEDIRPRFPEVASTDQLMAQILLARQNFDQALKIIEADIAKNPASVESRLALARTLASTERVEEARTQLEEVLNIDPANLEAHALLARIYLFMGDTDSAGKHISQIDETKVDPATNPALKAQILIQKDDLPGARDVCNAAVARGNPDPVLLLLLARIYIIEKNPELAEKNLLLLASAQPNNAQVWRLLGEFYQINKNLQTKGLNKLREMATNNDVLARIAMSGIYTSQGKYDEAMAVLEEVFPALLEKKDDQAFDVANAIARIHLVRKQILPARDVFKLVEDKGIRVNDARLRQIDLSWGDPSVHYTTTQLQELAKRLTPTDETMRSQVLARLARLNKHDEALYVLDDWIKESPKNSTLYRWKGEVLGQQGKYMESINAFRDAIRLEPTRLGLRARLVAAHLSNYDFPAAETELLELAKIDEKARMLAMAELGQLFTRLGLNKQAVKAFEEMEKGGTVTEPTILFAMGRAMAAMGLNDQARDRLAKVPPYARLYPSAQVELAGLEMRSGLDSQAKERIAAMVVDARSRARAMTELLSLNPYDRKEGARNAQLLQWADEALQNSQDSFAIIPRSLQSQWMRIRVILLDRNAGKHDGLDPRAAEEKARNDYVRLLQALEQWQQLEPNSIAILKGRLAVLARIDKIPEARQIYRSIPQLAETIHGPILAVVCGLEPTKVELRSPLHEYFVALTDAKPLAARAAVDGLETRAAIYKKDLLTVLARKDVTDQFMRSASRQMATAWTALEAGLPHLSASLSENLVRVVPDVVPAHSVLAQALLSQGLPLDGALAVARKSIPDAGITAYMGAETKIDAGDYKGAVDDLIKLLETEPDNIHARYRLAQVYQLTNQYEQSIQILEKMHAQGGAYRVMVANDLAYLLATYQGNDRLKEAHEIADRAYNLVRQQGGNALGASALLDTIGWIEFKRDNHNAAVSHLSRSIVELSDRAEVHYHLGMAYQKIGNMTWARYHLAKAATGDEKLQEVVDAKAQMSKLGP